MIYKVNKDFEEVRLDRFLKKTCVNNSLSEIFQAIRKGKVKVNGRKSKENYRLKLDDEIKIQDLDFLIKEKKSKEIKDRSLVFYEDDDIVIIDKPSGVSMHKGTKNQKGLSEMFNITFANRLDKKTKGLVIACKNPKSLREINKLIREDRIIKKYRAVCIDNGKYKINDEFLIENKLLETNEKVIVDSRGKLCKTKFKVTYIKDGKIYFEIRLYTGRKHQIRVQLANIGLPIIGDDKYGKYDKEDDLLLECFYLEFNSKVYQKK